MNTRKFVSAFIAVFVVLEITNYLVHGLILGSTYTSEVVSNLFRPMEDMQSKMWVMWVADLVWSFFFVLIFIKGFQNKGIFEGIRYGIYIGLFWSFVHAYGQYSVFQLPYSLIFQWFIFGFIQSIVLGIVAAQLYKPAKVSAA